MDSMLGCLSFILPEKQVHLSCQNMASCFASSSYASCHVTPWGHGPFAMSASSFKDGLLVCPDQKTLFYCNGYFQIDGRPVFAGSPGRFVLDSAGKLLRDLKVQGSKVLRKMSGSYLLLIYDVRQRTLQIVTDRLASRPLFYHKREGIFLFASDIRALLQDPGLDRSLDLYGVVEYLRFSMLLEDRTLYQGIKTVPPATILEIDPGGLRFQRYWSLDFVESYDRADQDYIASLAQVFKQASSRLVQDPDRSALMLSGGLDSRMIAASLWASGKQIRAISFGGFENDEVKLARRVAAHCDFPFVFLKRSPDYYQGIYPGAVNISNGLYTFYHAHLLGLHGQIRTLGIDTLIHGWGLDVLFSSSYQPKRLVRHLPGRSFYLLWPRCLETQADVVESLYSALTFWDDPLHSNLPAKLLGEIWHAWPKSAIARMVEKSSQHAGDFHNQFDWVILENFSRFRSYLYPLSVRWGFRERCPLYDNAVLDQYLCLPPRLRFCSRAYGKALEVLSKPLTWIPYSRTGSSLRAPEFIQTISYFLKPGIQTSRLKLRQIVRQHQEYPGEAFDSYPRMDILFRQTALSEIAQERFTCSILSDLGLVNSNVLMEMLDRHLRGDANYGEQLATFLTLETWLSDWS